MTPGADADARSGVSLCLSGRGFRATLFHLGALRRLNELGVISKLDTISPVSGGSRTAAALATALAACAPLDWPPPICNPRKLRLDPGRFTGGRFPAGRRRDRLVRGMRLTDGGNYDNLGLEPVWKARQVVLVSDGGAPFDVSEDRGLLWRVERYSAIAQNQAHAV